MRTKDSDPGLTAMIIICAVLGTLVIAYDVWEVASGRPEPGLFILPIVLLGFMAILIHLKRLSSYSKAEAQRLLEEGRMDCAKKPLPGPVRKRPPSGPISD